MYSTEKIVNSHNILTRKCVLLFNIDIVLAEKKYLPQKRNASLENKIAINRLLEQNVKVMVQEFPNEEAFVIEKYRIEGRREGE